MLKIKNSVDLKELKKFGFEKNGVNNKTVVKQNGASLFESSIVIAKDKSRSIYFTYNNGSGWLPIDNTLYDLIKADLIEKAEE